MTNVGFFCPRCGSTEQSSGELVGNGVGFKPDDCKFWVAGTSQVQVRGRMCRECGALQLEGDLAKLERLDPSEGD
jgi:NMD protein affecting ribosome stability and mRNA decay